MIFRCKTWVLALLLGISASPAIASNEYNSSIIINAGYGKAQNACTSQWASNGIPGASCSEQRPVFRFAYDYQFTPVWGFEISYGDLAKAEAHGTAFTGYPGVWRMKASGWAVAGTGTFPMGGGFYLLGKIGGVRAEFDENLHTYCTICSGAPGDYSLKDSARIKTAKGALTYGIGLQYNFNETIAVRAQYESFGKYKLTSPAFGETLKINLSQISTGFVLKF
jgi:OOP family OmpA-OmpF porin